MHCASCPKQTLDAHTVAQKPAPDTPIDRGLLNRLLLRWGRTVVAHRLLALILPVVIAIACIPILTSMQDRLSPGGWLPGSAESVQVDHRLDREFGRHSTAHYLLFTDPTGQFDATSNDFRREMERTLAPLRRDSTVTAVYTWGTVSNPEMRSLLISDDGTQAIAVVLVDQDVKEAAADFPRLFALIENDMLSVQVGGWPATTHDFRELTSGDLARAETISLPITLVLLVVFFGGLLIAGLPIVATVLALVPALAIMTLVSRVIETSVFTVNVVVMIGLAVGVDYALIFVSRYREERVSRDAASALDVTMTTAGRTIVVSGAVVATGLSGLFTFGVPAATATAIAAGSVVILSVVASLSILPAALLLIGDRAIGRDTDRKWPWWGAAGRVRAMLDRHPWPALTVSTLVLLLMALPIASMIPATPTLDVLPESQPARQMHETVQQDFTAATLSPIYVIVEPRRSGAMSSSRNLTRLQDFIEAIETIDGVESVTSVWSFIPNEFGANLISGGIRIEPELRAVVMPYLTSGAAVLEVNVHAGAGASEVEAVVERLRNDYLPLSDGDFVITVGGESATTTDLMDHLADRLPWTLATVLLLTSVVLYIQFRSVLLPIKAILLNMLALAASFGALVWVFQEGHFAGLLGFEPLGYTVVIVPLLMFCFMFGLSMDYEVIMLSRIREAWLETGDNRLAVSTGLRGSARIVTSAALIMFLVFASFGASDLQVIQQIGLGLALAVFLDATIIRLVALPAAMQLMGRWNWWAPGIRQQDPTPTRKPLDEQVGTP
jgi:RND superfamily putative drug exporter